MGAYGATGDFDQDDFEQDFYVIGDRVYVDSNLNPASVAYFGEVEFAQGDWVGVVLDEKKGLHDGKWHGRQYFQCSPFHGLFVRPNRVWRIPDSALGSSATSSRITTPMPSIQQRFGARSISRSPAASSSIMDSYFYDEDYRQPLKPSVDTLMQKLKSLNHQRQTNSSILKNTNRHSDRSHSSEPSTSGRNTRTSTTVHEDNCAYSTSPLPTSSPVLHFRPKRAQLDEFFDTKPSPSSQGRVSIVSDPPLKGDRVLVRTERGEMAGILRFMGETEFATGEWAGVELDEPEGRNDGCIFGRRYFYSPQGYGLFVPAVRVRKYKETDQVKVVKPEFNSMRYTITSPPPVSNKYTSTTSSRSTTPSYGRGRDSSTSLSSSSLNPDNSTKDLFGSSSRLSPTDDNNYYMLPLRTNNSMLNKISSYSYDVKPKFDERDIDVQLKKTLQKSNLKSSKITSHNIEPIKPKSVKYTFSSSKYDGNPIVRRTVQYN